MNDSLLRIGVSPRVCLLTLSTVRALRGCVTEKIKHEVDSGKFIWVFDFSLSVNAPDSRSQALRFWVVDVAESDGVKDLKVDDVVDQIIPPTCPSFSSEDLCLRFSVNRVTLFRLSRCWGCDRGRMKREVLAGFLKSRWLGEALEPLKNSLPPVGLTQPHGHHDVQERPVDLQNSGT
ncbi:MAG TPA: hypothetical protein VGI03_07015 [Verrucomicrobiae bacterium]|jgi:hypothetical protein